MDKTQGLLGHYGKRHYIGPFGSIQIPNYDYIINTVHQIRTGQAEQNDLLMCDAMMVRYTGAMSRTVDSEEKELKIPSTGHNREIQFYLGLPIRLLNWFGIISDTSFDKIVSSKLLKVLAGIGGLAGFLSSIVSILQGWPAIKELFK